MDSTKFDLSYITGKIHSLFASLDGLHMAGVWPIALLLVVSVLIGLYGGKLTHLLVVMVFALLGATIGQRVGAWLSLPFWPTVVFVAALGGIMAFVLYRYALGLVLAVSLALACGAWSLGTHLDKQEISDVLAGLTASNQTGRHEQPADVATSPADSAVPPEVLRYVERLQGVAQQAQDLRQRIADRPEAQKHLIIMMLAGGAVGLLAGLALGRAAAILWTSLLGGAGVVISLANLAVLFRPEWREMLSNNPRYVVGAAAGIALLFVLRQASKHKSSSGAAVAEVASPSDKS